MVDPSVSELKGRQASEMQRLAVLESAARELLDSSIAMHSLQVGEAEPDFELPNRARWPVRLSDLLREGPIVLTFYRGRWCRWCRSLFAALEDAAAKVRALGAQLVVLSPQTPSRSRATAQACSLSYPVLRDVESRVARRCGLTYTLPMGVCALGHRRAGAKRLP
jgi:peroxiredoxin